MLLTLHALEDVSDRARYQALYMRYRGLMFHVANGVLGNAHDAEEAVQEAFIEVFQNFDKISEIASPRTRSLVVLITERRAIDMLRAKMRRPTDELSEEPEGVEMPLPEGSLASAIARLPANYREALLLHYADGYSLKEVAELMGLTYDAARKLISRAREKLREILREEGDDL